MTKWSSKTDVSTKCFVGWLGIARGKFYSWKRRYGLANEHNGTVPRDHWLEESERRAIIDFHSKHPLNGYRRLSFMMLDADVAFVSPSTTYRVLRSEGLLDRWNRKPSKKGTGFSQPSGAHDHWQVDIAYTSISRAHSTTCVPSWTDIAVP